MQYGSRGEGSRRNLPCVLCVCNEKANASVTARTKRMCSLVSQSKTAHCAVLKVFAQRPRRDSRRLLHVSWIKMLSTAKTSENTSFSEVFCCLSLLPTLFYMSRAVVSGGISARTSRIFRRRRRWTGSRSSSLRPCPCPRAVSLLPCRARSLW